jgi:hypothetical protein
MTRPFSSNRGRGSARPTLYVFRSEKNAELNAFATSPTGSGLPEKFAPWIGTGSVAPHAAPPFGLSREAIESGIAERGFQLWRRTKHT